MSMIGDEGTIPGRDLLFYLPQLCGSDELREYVEGGQITTGPAFGGGPSGTGWDYDPLTNRTTMYAAQDGVVTYGTSPTSGGLQGTQAHMMTVGFGDTPYTEQSVSNLYSQGSFEFYLSSQPSSSRYLGARIQAPSGVMFDIESTIVPQANTAYEMYSTYEYLTGELSLYINGDLAGQAQNPEEGFGGFPVLEGSDEWYVQLPEGAGVTDVATFNGIPNFDEVAAETPYPEMDDIDDRSYENLGGVDEVTIPWPVEVGGTMQLLALYRDSRPTPLGISGSTGIGLAREASFSSDDGRVTCVWYAGRRSASHTDPDIHIPIQSQAQDDLVSLALLAIPLGAVSSDIDPIDLIYSLAQDDGNADNDHQIGPAAMVSTVGSNISGWAITVGALGRPETYYWCPVTLWAGATVCYCPGYYFVPGLQEEHRRPPQGWYRGAHSPSSLCVTWTVPGIPAS